MEEGSVVDAPKKFLVAGLISSKEYQRCKYYCEKLHKYQSETFLEPVFRPMMDVAWTEFLTNKRRELGGDLWRLEKKVAVFMDDKFLGDDDVLVAYISEEYILVGDVDYEELGRNELRNYFIENMNAGREYAYLTIAIEDVTIGTMLFLLYADLLPETVGMFLAKMQKHRNGFKNTPIHRIVKGSWIQCGGWDLKNHRLPCENYSIPHDRRGVLSTCHDGKHRENTRQFSITLAPTPWMDQHYVAFGQLVQGETILHTIEQIPTNYESPTKKIEIVHCGRFSLSDQEVDPHTTSLDDYLNSKHSKFEGHVDRRDARDKESELMLQRYQTGLYFAATDVQSNLPLMELPDYLMSKIEEVDEEDSLVESDEDAYEAEVVLEVHEADLVKKGEFFYEHELNYQK